MLRFFLLLLSTALLFSCELPFQVSTSVPIPVPKMKVSLASGVGQATAHWDPVSGAEGYRVAWTTSSSEVAGGSVETAATTLVVDRLQPGVNYEVTVTALGQDGPLAQGTAPWSSEGWTWESDLTSHMSLTSTEVQYFDIGDRNQVMFVLERTTTLDQFERLSYTTDGFTHAKWLRKTTSPPKTNEPAVVENPVQTTVATWVEPWARFTASGEETVAFSADRKTFTLASSPDVEWHWVP